MQIKGQLTYRNSAPHSNSPAPGSLCQDFEACSRAPIACRSWPSKSDGKLPHRIHDKHCQRRVATSFPPTTPRRDGAAHRRIRSRAFAALYRCRQTVHGLVAASDQDGGADRSERQPQVTGPAPCCMYFVPSAGTTVAAKVADNSPDGRRFDLRTGHPSNPRQHEALARLHSVQDPTWHDSGAGLRSRAGLYPAAALIQAMEDGVFACNLKLSGAIR